MELKVLDSSPEESWYADGLRFNCTECGNCCTGEPGFVWISQEEVGRLAEFLQLPAEAVIERYCRKIGGKLSLREVRNRRTGEHDCVFMRDEPAKAGGETKRICSVYSVRPLQCRTWPFWAGNLESPAAWQRAAIRCPGIGIGRTFDRAKIESLRDAEDWPQDAPTSE